LARKPGFKHRRKGLYNILAGAGRSFMLAWESVYQRHELYAQAARGLFLWPVHSPPAERMAPIHFPAVCDCFFVLKDPKTTLNTKAGRLPRSAYIKPPFHPLRRSIPPTVVSTDDDQQRQATIKTQDGKFPFLIYSNKSCSHIG
jgi:hypothetical protein